jgi:hypothetical protein
MAASNTQMDPQRVLERLKSFQAGVILTGAVGAPLDRPMDTTTGISWIGYANAPLRASIDPLVQHFFLG